MSTTSDIRNGLCINYNHDIYKIIEFLHVKPGKGPAFVRTKLKSLTIESIPKRDNIINGIQIQCIILLISFLWYKPYSSNQSSIVFKN